MKIINIHFYFILIYNFPSHKNQNIYINGVENEHHSTIYKTNWPV